MASGKNRRDDSSEKIIQEKIVHEKQRRRNSMFMNAVCVIVCIIMVCAVCQGNLRKTEGAQDATAGDAAVSYEAAAADMSGTSDSEVVSGTAEESVTEDSSYFATSLLVGDSRAETLGLYSDIPEWDMCAAKDLNIENVTSVKAARNASGETCTVMELAAQKEYESIYLSFGLEELDMYNEKFISGYKEFLNSLIKAQPTARIYVMSVLPVSAELSSSGKMYNNPDIDRMNMLLENMCEAYDNVTYLDVSESVSESGVLPEDAGTDGVHINKKYCQKIVEYIKKNVCL